uniref:NUP210 Ig-like domain-containing protein n=1 Tax=Hucho hucho TaxID=62062 RepID=A0A4W5LYK1_9TELE
MRVFMYVLIRVCVFIYVCTHACVIVCFRDTICPVRYALCQCVKGEGLVTVDSQRVLRAGPDTGSALLEVIAMETCGVNQTLHISVRVSPVWFVRLFSVSSLYSVGGGGLPAFPLGWTIRVRALCYDNLGQQFNAHNTLTHITTNRPARSVECVV